MTVRRLALALAIHFALFLAVDAVRAELVILTDASVLKVRSYKVEGNDAILTFASGGALRMSMLRVERVVDDEVLPEPEKGAEALERSGLLFAVRFAEGQARPTSAYSDLIFETARRHKINPQLVAAVIRAESAFNPRALSNKGARGLMQLMPATASSLQVHDSFHPAKNIDGGVRYLRYLLNVFRGDLSLALAAYNAGEKAVAKYNNSIPPYQETQHYVRRVLSYFNQYKNGTR